MHTRVYKCMKNQRSCWVSCSLIFHLFPWDEVSNWTWTGLVDPPLSPILPRCCWGYRLCATTPRLWHGWWTHGLTSGPHAFCSRCSYWPSHLPSLTSHFKKTKAEKKTTQQHGFWGSSWGPYTCRKSTCDELPLRTLICLLFFSATKSILCI